MSATPDPPGESQQPESQQPEPQPSESQPSAPARRPVRSAPQPPSKPPRSAMTARDMIGAILVLGLIVLVTGGLTRGCSFSPGGPTIDQNAVRVVDVAAELRQLAPRVPFVLHIPAVPAGWRSNSAEQDRVDPANPAAGRAIRIGYLTAEGRYLRLLQSDATEEALVAVEAGARPLAAQGTVEAGGYSFVVYGNGDDEPIWIGERPDGVRLLITGSADEADYRALADAVRDGEALPVGVAPPS